MSAPLASAGAITSSTSCARAAANSAASAQGAICLWLSTSSRISSPTSVPPGSRVATTSRRSAASASASSRACVDLPDPSRPSKVTNTAGLGYEPLRAIVTGGAGFIGSHVVDALLARGDDVLVLDDLSRGKRENVPEDAQLDVVDIREPLDFSDAQVCFHLAAQVDVRGAIERPEHDETVKV